MDANEGQLARVEGHAFERVEAGGTERQADIRLAAAERDGPLGEGGAERLAAHRDFTGHRVGGEAEAARRRTERERQELRSQLDVELPRRARQAFADEEVRLVDDRRAGLGAIDGGFLDDATDEAGERRLRGGGGRQGHTAQGGQRQHST
jgi:hypothetical protein